MSSRVESVSKFAINAHLSNKAVRTQNCPKEASRLAASRPRVSTTDAPVIAIGVSSSVGDITVFVEREVERDGVESREIHRVLRTGAGALELWSAVVVVFEQPVDGQQVRVEQVLVVGLLRLNLLQECGGRRVADGCGEV